METDKERRARQKQEHRDKYEDIVERMGGFERFEHLMPVSITKIRVALLSDEYLNNIQLHRWDAMDGFMRTYAAGIGIRSWSLAESVSTLKCAARLLAEHADEQEGGKIFSQGWFDYKSQWLADNGLAGS